MGNCHICGEKTDWICEKCDEYVCGDCTVGYTQFNQVDYTLCSKCDNYTRKAAIEERDSENEYEKKRIALKNEKNKKAREYYNSEKAKDKRRIKKTEQAIKRIEFEKARAERLSKIFKSFESFK